MEMGKASHGNARLPRTFCSFCSSLLAKRDQFFPMSATRCAFDFVFQVAMSSYHHRYVLLSTILENLEVPDVNNDFILKGGASQEDVLGYRLDSALSAGSRREDNQALMRACIQESDFSVVRRVANGQFGIVSH